MANRCMKICLTSVNIKEMQIATTVRHHFTPVRMAIIKKKTKKYQMLEKMQRTGNSYTLLVRLEIGAAIMEDDMENPPKIKLWALHMVQLL